MRGFILFLALILPNCITYASEQPGKQWGVLVAGSMSWYNYRHQADVCHAYQILHSHGIPDEQIIVMMYDDIANSQENPFPGKVYNTETGPDVYHGVPKDYTGEDVTPQNFLNVLLGKGEEMKNIGSGKVLNSGPNDNVFINFADHGGPGIIAFPNAFLHAHDLINTLKQMHEQKRYNKLVFYMEACESGSMFKNILPDTWNIYATTAANSTISSWGCDCPPNLASADKPFNKKSRAEQLRTCLSDCYSVNWMSDSDRVHLNEETLYQQFEYVRDLSWMQIEEAQHIPEKVKEFGNLTIGKTSKLSEFMGRKTAEKHYFAPPAFFEARDAREIERYLLLYSKNYDEVEKFDQDQAYFKQQFHKLIEKILFHFGISIGREITFVMKNQPDHISDTLCHKNFVEMFTNSCKDLYKRSRGLNFWYTFQNLCLLRKDFPALDNTAEIQNVMEDYCRLIA